MTLQRLIPRVYALSGYLAAVVLIALSPAPSLANGPSQQKVTKQIQIAAPAEKVWALINDFCSIEIWHPAVYSCKSSGGNDPGATRLLTLGEDGGPQLHEELQKYETGKMSYQYKITKTDMAVLPVTMYSGSITVRDNSDNTSTVEWTGGFYRGHPHSNPPPELNDEAAVNAITGVYDAGLVSIKKLAER